MKVTASRHEFDRANYNTYFIGYVLSIICTLAAYLLSVHFKGDHKMAIVFAVATLAITQFAVQVSLFLHLGSESRPKIKLLMFSIMLGVVLIVVGGSLWIMYNLNYRMTPQQMNSYLNSQDGGL